MTDAKKDVLIGASRLTAGLDIVTEVNTELAESIAQMHAAGEPTRQGDTAHDEFLELVICGNKVPAVADFLHQVFRFGAGVIDVRVDPHMTSRAMREVFRYDLEGSLQKLLAACRAGNFVAWIMALVEIHGDT